MQVFADLGQIPDGGDQPLTHMAGVRARKADALDTRCLVDGLQQPTEVALLVVWRLE